MSFVDFNFKIFCAFLWAVTVAVVGNSVFASTERKDDGSGGPRVYLSTEPMGGSPSNTFDCSGEIYAFVSLGKISGKRRDVIGVEWVRPDGAVQEAPHVKLKDNLSPGGKLRFWIKLKPTGGSLLDEFQLTGGGSSAGTPTEFDGTWSLRVFYNNSKILVVPFRISCDGI